MQIKRVSVTIPENLLKNLDAFVKLKQKINPSESRSGVISNLIELHVPVE